MDKHAYAVIRPVLDHEESITVICIALTEDAAEAHRQALLMWARATADAMPYVTPDFGAPERSAQWRARNAYLDAAVAAGPLGAGVIRDEVEYRILHDRIVEVEPVPLVGVG